VAERYMSGAIMINEGLIKSDEKDNSKDIFCATRDDTKELTVFTRSDELCDL
jgi:hypothetical protein